MIALRIDVLAIGRLFPPGHDRLSATKHVAASKAIRSVAAFAQHPVRFASTSAYRWTSGRRFLGKSCDVKIRFTGEAAVVISKFIATATMTVCAIAGLEIAGMDVAAAADLSAPVYTKAPVVANPAYDWSGFYLGGHVGHIWGKSRVTDNGVLTESGAPTNGAVGGILTGYNWQSGPLLLGVEGDIGWSNAEGHGTPIPPPAPAPVAAPNTYKLEWDSHIVGKAGFALDRWSIFATGGVAIAGFSFQQGVLPTEPLANSISKTYVGFSVGAGVEYAFTQNLLGRLQYIYDDFGSQDYTAVDGGAYNVKLTDQTLRGALSWKF
jgi:outer membrane immunogenic protein